MRKTLQFVVLPIDQGQERYNAPSRKEAGREFREDKGGVEANRKSWVVMLPGGGGGAGGSGGEGMGCVRGGGGDCKGEVGTGSEGSSSTLMLFSRRRTSICVMR